MRSCLVPSSYVLDVVFVDLLFYVDFWISQESVSDLYLKNGFKTALNVISITLNIK